MASQNLITKEELIKVNDTYWKLVNRARELLIWENPDKKDIDVEEIHVDPDEDYVFVSWKWYKEDDGFRYKSTTYRINKFLSLINKDENVDPNDRIAVELKGAKK